jgi:hypothetical protein
MYFTILNQTKTHLLNRGSNVQIMFKGEKDIMFAVCFEIRKKNEKDSKC